MFPPVPAVLWCNFSTGFRAGVPDVLRFAEMNDVLGHVFGVVGDALKAFYRRPSNSGSG
jgi:hypothetical protein